ATFALNTAMRPSNILELTWDRINMDEQEALVPASQHKQSFAGHYLLNNKILNLLKQRKKESSSGLVFYLENGKKIPIKYLQQEWKRACKKVGVEDLHFYDMRHTCLSRLAGNGANVFLLKRVSQHASVNSLEKYVKAAGLTRPALEILNGAKL
ncbi:MAG: tyrosine-type recombinase/integrase, partial [Pseudomonadota bacterium]